MLETADRELKDSQAITGLYCHSDTLSQNRVFLSQDHEEMGLIALHTAPNQPQSHE